MGQVTVTLTGDEARLVRSLQKVIDKEREVARKALEAGKASEQGQRRAQRSLNKTNRELDRAKQKGDKAFGSGAVGQLGKFAGALGGVSSAAGLLLKVFDEINASREKFAQSARDSELGMRSLAQLAGGDAAKLRALSGQARELYGQGGARSQNEAAGVVFQLESAGINTGENRKTFGDLFGVIDDPVTFARSARTLQAAMGSQETGNIRGILSKAFAASGKSPAQAPALLEGAARGGAFARQLGISDEDLLAATAVTATTSGSAELGGTQAAALLKQLGRAKDPGLRAALRDVGGRSGLGGILSLLEDRGLTSQDGFTEQFGNRAEAFVALQSLRENRGLFESARDDQYSAERSDLVGRIIGSADADPSVRIARQRRIAEARAELAGESVGARRNLADTSYARLRAQFLAEGTAVGEFKAGVAGVSRWLGTSAVGEALQLGATDQVLLEGQGENLLRRDELEALRSIQQNTAGERLVSPGEDR